MRLRFNVVISSALVTSIGIITLLGLLVGDDLGLLSAVVSVLPIRLFAEIFLRLAVVTVALSVLLGVANLLFVHTNRVLRNPRGRLGSLALLISFVGALLLRILDSANGTNNSRFLFDDVLVAMESALGGLLAISLIYGAFRVVQRHPNIYGVLFLASLLVVLIGSLPFSPLTPLRELSLWLMAVPVHAGARGILLGIGLATLVAGLRVLIGQDRSVGE